MWWTSTLPRTSSNRTSLLLSVVIPHHGTPRLLARLLATLPDCEGVEVIVVDDHSPAGQTADDLTAAERCRAPRNLTILRASGSGAGNARNEGIDAAQGQWLLFADADDFFLPGALQAVLQHCDADHSGLDMVFFDGLALASDTMLPSNREWHPRLFVADWFATPGKRSDVEFALRYEYGAPYCRLVKAALLQRHAIRFDRTPRYEDTLFATRCGLLAGSIEVDRRAIYCVTERPDSYSLTANEELELVGVSVFAHKERMLAEAGIKSPIWRHYWQTGEWYAGNRPMYVRAREALRREGLDGWHVWRRMWRFALKAVVKRLIGWKPGVRD